MAKFEKRLEARKLRRQGWSIRSIATHLDVSRASSSVWCRDLELTAIQRKRLVQNAINAGLQGRLIGAEMNRRKKEERVRFHQEAGKRAFQGITKREFLIAGLSLYWGEGSKKSRLGFVNSDPAMIQFMFRWFQEAMGVKKKDFMPRIFINAIHKPRIAKVLRFWSGLLQLPAQQFGNPVFINRNPRKVYENYDSYYGLLAIHTSKSTELKYRILGLIDGLKDTGINP